jgi:hypothetical protein
MTRETHVSPRAQYAFDRPTYQRQPTMSIVYLPNLLSGEEDKTKSNLSSGFPAFKLWRANEPQRQN